MSIVSSKSDLISQEYSRLGKVLGIDFLSVDLRTSDTTNLSFIKLDKMMEETPIEKKHWLHRDLDDLEEWFATSYKKSCVHFRRREWRNRMKVRETGLKESDRIK